jgi:hypothetical protein
VPGVRAFKSTLSYEEQMRADAWAAYDAIGMKQRVKRVPKRRLVPRVTA